jgi:hypothetical protein
MTTKQQIREILKSHKKQALACLYPEMDYTWGTTKQNRQKSVDLMRSILKDIPLSTWPEETEDKDSLIIRDGNWRLDLWIDNDEYHANLHYLKDDHTAWVNLVDGVWEDFDIGGS